MSSYTHAGMHSTLGKYKISPLDKTDVLCRVESTTRKIEVISPQQSIVKGRGDFLCYHVWRTSLPVNIKVATYQIKDVLLPQAWLSLAFR